MWVKMVLKPYVDAAPQNVVPLLFLDSYHCHMMNSVVNAIQNLGVEVKHIPGGCTSLCQPVDIGINKPFKAFLHIANRKKSKALNKVTKSHTMLAQDSFLGSLLVLPVEVWNGIAG